MDRILAHTFSLLFLICFALYSVLYLCEAYFYTTFQVRNMDMKKQVNCSISPMLSCRTTKKMSALHNTTYK